MRTLALVIAASLSLSACERPVVGVGTPIVDICTASDRTLIDEKVVYAAEAIFNIPAQAYKVANENGNLKEPLKGQAKSILIRMDDLRLAINAAKGTATCDFNELQKLQAQVLKLIP